MAKRQQRHLSELYMGTVFKTLKEGFMKKIVLYILPILIISVFSSVSLAAIPVQVSVGRGTIVTLKEPSKRVSISNPEIAELNLISPSEILINGKKVGATTLIVWDKKGKPTFFDVVVFGDTSEAQQVLLEVKVAQIDRTKLKELGLNFLVKGHDAEITAPGLFTSPDGNVGGDAGFKVTPGIGSFNLDSLVPQIGVAYFPSGVAAVLKAIQGKGLGKILAEPNLIVRSGEKGNFHVGTRVPIQTVTGVGANATVSITYEEVGIRLNFTPEVLENGAIRLKIDPAEVSSISRYLSFQGAIAPEIDTRTVRTSVDLKEGESIILAGLLSEEMKKNIDKIPILGDIPILGALFRSTKDELKEKELAFFITPRLVKPAPPGVKTELPTDKRPTPEEEREFQWIPIPGKSAPEAKPESKSE